MEKEIQKSLDSLLTLQPIGGLLNRGGRALACGKQAAIEYSMTIV
jgi:hypothetical protein